MAPHYPPKGKHNVPLLYSIPQINKEPVTMRPMIPCHSTIQNPAAKYISKILKPIIKWIATIIHETKDLAMKLSAHQLQNDQKYYFEVPHAKKCKVLKLPIYLENMAMPWAPSSLTK